MKIFQVIECISCGLEPVEIFEISEGRAETLKASYFNNHRSNFWKEWKVGEDQYYSVNTGAICKDCIEELKKESHR